MDYLKEKMMVSSRARKNLNLADLLGKESLENLLEKQKLLAHLIMKRVKMKLQ
jgi:hypothetical protein